MHRRSLHRRTILAALAAAALPAPLRAQAFPARPVKLVVPFAPAGGTDIAARLVGERLAEKLGQQVVIDNRPGANGAIAGEVVARAEPDGYTLLVATAAGFAGAPALGQKLPYDVAKDFLPVGMLGLFPLVLNVSPGLPVKSLPEFLAYARERPGTLNYASAGVGGTNHLVMELISQAAGIRMTHVPYRGAALAATDVMSGQVQCMVDSLASSLGNIQTGKIRALAVTTAGRQPQVPEVPTLKEQGVDLVYPGWASIVAPARTPAAVVDRLSQDLAAALAAEALVKRYRDLVIEPVAWAPDVTARFMAEDRRVLTELVQKVGIRME
jgi:tripartite-type tricarboxylate transporter receptor subunit TctC